MHTCTCQAVWMRLMSSPPTYKLILWLLWLAVTVACSLTEERERGIRIEC